LKGNLKNQQFNVYVQLFFYTEEISFIEKSS